ncbi:MAG: hypothetical protein AB7I27_17675 [Bacteriovoracaceae bacterium]
MKFLVLILTIFFSYSVLADCCSTVSFEENCQIETLKDNQCSDAEHSSTNHDVCHCSFACASKIIKNPTAISISLNSFMTIVFYQYDHSFKSITLSPGLRPPIA